MKFLKSKYIKLGIVLLLLSSFAYLGSEQKPELSQTVPPDMIYVKGNDSIPSFYISITEESNLNWRIYTNWLRSVYVDYPDVYEQALPLNNIQLTASRYNDPVIDNYVNHPAYNYYPVVGVSWTQIQDYLHWKTDRLNEAIMIRNNFSVIDYRQVNEENFNTETNLEGQYLFPPGDSAKYSLLERGEIERGFNPRQFILNNGIYIPHFRLPTEAEWDYANSVKKQVVKAGKKFSIYGNNYFLNYWEKFIDKIGKQNQYPSYPNTNIMESGVEEWLMDIEGFQLEKGYGSFDIYTQNGFSIINKYAVFDADGVVDVKDSLGRFPFIFVDYGSLNKPIYVMRHYLPKYEVKVMEIENPFYQNPILYKEYANMWYDNGKYKWMVENNRKDEWLTMKTCIVETVTIHPYVYQKRKVKSGNWKYISDETILMNENEASELTGFRCVLPATSVAVDPKYKVKWD